MNIMAEHVDKDLQTWLNVDGSDGWELVQLVKDGYKWTAVYKRKVTNE